MFTPQSNHERGFTLAELLIALAILGVIATFTIPKILDGGSSSQSNAMAKEAASMLAGAFQAYKLQNSVSGSTSCADLTPYMNYVSVVTNETIDIYDNTCTYATQSCATYGCLRLHNGGILSYHPLAVGSFQTLDSTSGIGMGLDPDGKLSGAANTAGHTVGFILYSNGRLTSGANVLPNSYAAGLVFNPNPACDPPWFSWGN